MNAIPPAIHQPCRMSTAETTQSVNPVREIAFGVSRDSMRRLRNSVW